MSQNASADWLCLQDRVCVVTGAGSGIGAETAREFARAGAWVAVLDRNAAGADAVAAEIVRSGGRAIAVHANVGDPASVAAAAQRVQSELGPCRTLVNNAALRHREDLIDISLESWNRVLSVNLSGALLCAQAFARQMISGGPGGSMVHVSSLVGTHPQADSGAYCVSKAGLNMLSRILAVELGKHGIRSNVVSPGFTRTPANEAAYSNPELAAARAAIVPIGRFASPLDLAQVIVYLASDRAGYVDGQEITVDGAISSVFMSLVPRAAPKK